MKTSCLLVCSLICLLSAHAQPPDRNQLAGIWIGVHTEWATDVFCPLPTYLRLDADGAYTLGMVDGTATPIRSTWAVQSDSVRLDTIRYAPGLVRVQNNLLQIGTLYPMVFRRFNDLPLDSATIVRHLVGRIWQSDSLFIGLHANSRVTLRKSGIDQQTVHYWRLATFNKSVFMVIYGNQYGTESDFKPLWQLVEASAGEFQVVAWHNQRVTNRAFRLVRPLTPDDTDRSVGFQTCSTCFTNLWFDTPTGREQRYDLWHQAQKHYRSVALPGQSGLVLVRFTVNCAGEQGMFDVTGFGDDYCPRSFDSRITNQLLTICRNYVSNAFAARSNDLPSHRQEDSGVSLTFRIKNGHLTDLLP